MQEYGDGRIKNFLALPKGELVERVQSFTHDKTASKLKVPALASKLVEFHERHPRKAVRCRATRIPKVDRQCLMSLLDSISWWKYTVNSTKYTKVNYTILKATSVKQTKYTKVNKTFLKATSRNSVRAAAVGSQNFVLGTTRGALGSSGFEKKGDGGIGKNTTIVKSRQKKDKRVCMTLWRTMMRMVKAVDPDYTFSSMQVNKNFRGQPHRDKGDHSYQYALSLGNFTGGELLIETDDPQRLTIFETKDRLTKCDGRRPHWVAPYFGTRYSLIMYRCVGKKTPLLSNRGTDTNASPV